MRISDWSSDVCSSDLTSNHRPTSQSSQHHHQHQRPTNHSHRNSTPNTHPATIPPTTTATTPPLQPISPPTNTQPYFHRTPPNSHQNHHRTSRRTASDIPISRIRPATNQPRPKHTHTIHSRRHIISTHTTTTPNPRKNSHRTSSQPQPIHRTHHANSPV